jgi:hypothetical protein
MEKDDTTTAGSASMVMNQLDWAYIERFKRTLLTKLPQRYTEDKLDEIVTNYNNTKHSSLNDTPTNRYEQNPNRGIITLSEYDDNKYTQVKRRKTNHPIETTNERKRKREYITNSNGNSRKRLKV